MTTLLATLRRHGFHVSSGLQRWWYRTVWGMDIGRGVKLSRSARLDRTNPKGVHIGDWTAVTFDAAILTHDMQSNRHVDTWVGSHCFIGARAIIMPGVRIGDHSVVGAGAVVMSDVPPRSVVSGNPARVVRSGVVTGRWGIGDPRFLAKEEAAGRPAPAVEPPPPSPADAAHLSRAELLAMLRERRPELEDADLDRPFVELGLDSFDLISLRADLETRLGRAIPDARWQSLRCPADLAQPAADRYAAEPEPSAERRPAAPPPAATVVPMAKPRVRYSLLPPQRGDAPDGPAALPPNERHYRINLPQMAMRGLSEGWLFRELGDLHWAVLMHELKTQSASLADGAGHRLYATFTRVAFTSNVPLTDYRENERLAIRIDESRFGAAMFFGDARIEGVRGVATARLMTTFARFGEAGANTSLLKGQPVIPPECAIRDLGELPPFAVEYRQLRATPLPPAQAELDYEIQPFHDINGVGLLYFAAYPAIAELCLTRLKGPAFAFETSTVERDICYFANAEPTDTLIFRLHDWAEDDREVRYLASLARKSDGVTMARIRAVKRRVKLPPPGRPVEVED